MSCLFQFPFTCVYSVLNPFPDDKFLALSKLEDSKLNFIRNIEFVFLGVAKIVGKIITYWIPAFPLFPAKFSQETSLCGNVNYMFH